MPTGLGRSPELTHHPDSLSPHDFAFTLKLEYVFYND